MTKQKHVCQCEGNYYKSEFNYKISLMPLDNHVITKWDRSSCCF